MNAGSVGKPKDGGPRAGYLVVAPAPKLETIVRRVAYDVDAAAQYVR